ncbi:hypothetical protein F4815DRAFT_305909 [Daldinia loculata]|nr:hypothetical protein F4815DRAFT_305909 [Daldinia loculata]
MEIPSFITQPNALPSLNISMCISLPRYAMRLYRLLYFIFPETCGGGVKYGLFFLFLIYRDTTGVMCFYCAWLCYLFLIPLIFCCSAGVHEASREMPTLVLRSIRIDTS